MHPVSRCLARGRAQKDSDWCCWYPVVRGVVAAFSLGIAGCDKAEPSWQYPSASASTRPSAILSLDALTLATQADIDAAATAASDPPLSKAVSDYLGPGAPRWHLAAARDIGDYVLLWVGFPEVTDGGMDLVYAKAERRVKWHFKGGHRG